MTRAGLAIAALALTASVPALAGWDRPAWGQTLAELLARGDLAAAKTKDKKDERIHEARKLAQGQAEIDGVAYTVNYFFEPKADRLSKVNLVPEASQCTAARDSFTARQGEGKREIKRTVIMADRPELVQEVIDWTLPDGQGTISYVSVSFGEEMKYCQLLHEA